MTTGSIVRDYRIVRSDFCGTSRIGYYFLKQWNGADRVTPLPPKAPPNPPTVYTVTRRRKDGSTYNVLVTHRSKPSRPPKRARRDSDHPYQVQIIASINPATVVGSKNDPSFKRDGSVQSCIGTDPPAQWTWSSYDDIKLIQRLREKMMGSDFDAGVYLATSHQALNMIATNATKILNAYRDVRKGNIAQAARNLGVGLAKRSNQKKTVKGSADGVSSAWLELQYGWLPLLSDNKALAEFVAHQTNTPFCQTYRARLSKQTLPVESLSSNFKYTSGNVKESGSLIARLSEPPSIAQLSGLTDPLTISWELAPWSFVVDWFVPIGDWLQARGYASALTGSFTTTVKQTLVANGMTRLVNDAYTFTNTDSYRYSQVFLRRTVSSALNVPTPRFKPLGEVPSWRRAANAIALLVQQKV